MPINSEQSIVTPTGYTNTYTSTDGKISAVTNCNSVHTNIEAMGVGTHDIVYGEKSVGVTKDYFGQFNSNSSISIGGKSEFNCDGSQYIIVGDKEAALIDAWGNLANLKSGMTAARSTFNDNRHDNDISSGFGEVLTFNPNPVNLVKNQTNNNVDYGEPPAETGNVLQDMINAIGFDIDCAVLRTKANLKEQLYQQTVGKIDLIKERYDVVMENIDNLDCNPEVKDKLQAIKEEGDFSALASLPSAVINAITSKISHDGAKTDTFDADAYYQQYSDNSERIHKYEKYV